MAKVEMGKSFHLQMWKTIANSWGNFCHFDALWQCLKAKQMWHFSHLRMDILCHFNFYHNRWNSSCTIQYYYYSVFNNNVVVCMLKGLFILQVGKCFLGFFTSLMKKIPIYCLLNWISFICLFILIPRWNIPS